MPELIGDSLLGGNLYAYCNSNPVNNLDTNGYKSNGLSRPESGVWMELFDFLTFMALLKAHANEMIEIKAMIEAVWDVANYVYPPLERIDNIFTVIEFALYVSPGNLNYTDSIANFVKHVMFNNFITGKKDDRVRYVVRFLRGYWSDEICVVTFLNRKEEYRFAMDFNIPDAYTYILETAKRCGYEIIERMVPHRYSYIYY